MSFISTKDPQVLKSIEELVSNFGKDKDPFISELVTQMIQNSLRLVRDDYNTGQVKLINNTLKEIRYAYGIFNQYKQTHRISIFGSARTPENHPDYLTAKKFGEKMSAKRWMTITGAAEGIMKAGHEGSTAEESFGLSIRLPFESSSNVIIAGDPKLISFRYFFTRKLMFLSHSHAIAAFPGGFGTQDELFECLTLMQTGKATIIPVVLLEGQEGVYWKFWDTYVKKNFLEHGWISAEDLNFYLLAKNIDEAVEHVTRFYKRFHSYRYVGDKLVIRIKSRLEDSHIKQLNSDYSKLIASGEIIQTEALPEEQELKDLPRLVFHHTRKNFGTVRALIDSINNF
ncbi:MAG: hypothetical protein ACI8RA_001553 [Chlamydiales bacterium]|jgi:uncharacterized protein (TIGR00730 family)